jgi:hypothetical protein
MQAASTYSSSPSWSARHVTDYRFRPAATVAKDDLLELIRNFETASDRHGMMSFDHFRGFAARTGLPLDARAS